MFALYNSSAPIVQTVCRKRQFKDWRDMNVQWMLGFVCVCVSVSVRDYYGIVRIWHSIFIAIIWVLSLGIQTI